MIPSKPEVVRFRGVRYIRLKRPVAGWPRGTEMRLVAAVGGTNCFCPYVVVCPPGRDYTISLWGDDYEPVR